MCYVNKALGQDSELVKTNTSRASVIEANYKIEEIKGIRCAGERKVRKEKKNITQEIHIDKWIWNENSSVSTNEVCREERMSMCAIKSFEAFCNKLSKLRYVWMPKYSFF